MDIVLILAPISVLLGLAGLGAFWWTLRSGQYDDPLGDASRAGSGQTVEFGRRRFRTVEITVATGEERRVVLRAPTGPWDFVARDFVDLASLLGC